MNRHTLSLFSITFLATPVIAQAPADPSERLLQLARVPGVSGHESDVRKAVASMLPSSQKPDTESLGNLVVRLGTGAPHTLMVAPLDEPGYVISGINDDGYLRLHRHTTGFAHPLAHEYHLGQPVLIRTSTGTYLSGVTATPSTHLRGYRPAGNETGPRTIDDLFVDVGAAGRCEVAAQGIRMLDVVTLRERAARLAGAEIAGGCDLLARGRGGLARNCESIRRSRGERVRHNRVDGGSLLWPARPSSIDRSRETRSTHRLHRRASTGEE